MNRVDDPPPARSGAAPQRAPIRVGALAPGHRDRVAEILRATQLFREEEIDVALELFDEGCALRAADCEPAESRSAQQAGRSPASPPAHAASSDYLFLGAFTPEDELVGYACYGPTPGTDRTWDLYWIAVEPAAQGAGIGTILITEVEGRLQGQQARMLVVETSSRSDYVATRAFYERRGYGVSASVRDFYAPGDDRIILTKRFHWVHSPFGRGVAA